MTRADPAKARAAGSNGAEHGQSALGPAVGQARRRRSALPTVLRRGGMARYVAGRLAAGAGTLLVVSVVVFTTLQLIPGSYADIAAGGSRGTAERRAAIESEFGLDQPVPVQYVKWIGQAATGNFGASFGSGEPVAEQLVRRLPVTAELALLAVLFTVAIGLPLALAAGMARRRSRRQASRLLGALAMSTPDFVLGSVLVYVFSKWTLGLSVGGYVPFVDDPTGNLQTMVLPAFTLSVFGIAILVRTGRDAVASVLNSPHVTAATARGESTAHIVRHHVLRNAAIPMVTVLATYVGYLMGGAVIVENLFSLPGIGQSVLTGILNRDYAIVQGTVLVAAAVFIAINMFADFAYGLIDPRVLQEGRR